MSTHISVIGLGYVGVVSAACLAEEGCTVIGVDVSSTKVDLIAQGHSPIIEAGLADMLARQTANGKLTATQDVEYAIHHSDMSLVCVGTPSRDNGSLNLDYVKRVCEQIGMALKTSERPHSVVMRSTMLPGTMNDLVIPTLESSSGKKAGVDFGVCNNPEFLREGTAVYDFYHPPKTVIGEVDKHSGDQLAQLYEKLDAPLLRTDIATAEMVKYTDNVWHALKVGFANEIGNICKAVNVDSHKVMEIFCQDTKLNLSPYYMKPGFAFGGSCLPKDVRALTYKARSLDLDLPILNAVMNSNTLQIERAKHMIQSTGKKHVALLGLSFKAGTDDLRESPQVMLVEWLLGKGFDVSVFDSNVHLASLMGGNKEYILNHIPHIHRLLDTDIERVIDNAEVVVVGNSGEQFKTTLATLGEDKIVIDLVRILDSANDTEAQYQGICW
jgi:GDP-mannose 6-dehydrogenase